MTWIPVILWAGVIFYLSSIPSLSTGWGLWDFILRKMAHMMEFGILLLLLARAFRKTFPNWTVMRLVVLSGMAALLYAVSDEVHQSFVPGRTAAWTDVMIDGCGIILAILLYRSREKIEKT